MAVMLRTLAILALLTTSATLVNANGASGSGSTTRYWDCCKGSCSWSGKAPVSAPVKTCGKDNSPLSDANAKSACESNGSAYMCADQTPWQVSDNLSYGFAAVNIAGQTERDWCCSCYKLKFTSGLAKGKEMIVQATNTGGDLSGNQFDIAVPGGGVGLFNACTVQYGAPAHGWGKQYGGLTSNTCNEVPAALKDACHWRFNWLGDNPTVDFEQVNCPAELVAKTGCGRSDDLPLLAGFSNPTKSSSAIGGSSTTSSSQAGSSNTAQAGSDGAASTSAQGSLNGAGTTSSQPASSTVTAISSSSANGSGTAQNATVSSSSTFTTYVKSSTSGTTSSAPSTSSTAASAVGQAENQNGNVEEDDDDDTCES